MKMMNKKMESICRGAVSSLAGADDSVLAAVLNMRLKSAGASVEMAAEYVGKMLDERAKASEDYTY